MSKKSVSLLAGIVFTATLAGCASSPTGRRQLTLLPDGQLNTMGAQSFEEMKKQVPIESDPAMNTYVKCVVNPILNQNVDATGVKDWEVVVFKDPTPNAFALPGGKIGVHTGLLAVAKTDAQLAAVLGHEVGHVTARHGNERVSQGIIAQGAMVAADAFTGNSAQKPVIMGLLGVGTQVGVLLPFSRKHESEADKIGLELMAKAGFEPSESVRLWENMGAASGGKAPPQFMSTHPSNETRISALRAGIPGVQAQYAAAVAAGRIPRCTRPALK